MPQVRFFPGDGTEATVEVSYIASDFPRGPGGTCAFCQGDPCAESSPPDSPIALYFSRNKRAETCPMCQGRPS